MDTSEIFKYFFGTVGLVVAVGTVLTVANNVFNLRDRFIKWRKEKKDIKLKKESTDFQFTLNYVSNSQPSKCFLNTTLLNLSKETKYFDVISYGFRFKDNPDKFVPATTYINGEKWPKRLENGERFTTQVEFTYSLLNGLYDFWKKGVEVYVSCNTTTGDSLQSNSLEFDKLVGFLEPINKEYTKLSIRLSNLTNGSQRDIEASLWQLQIFERLTVYIAEQLHSNNIPIVKYLIEEHGLELKEDPWFHWYSDLEDKKIPSQTIVDYLDSLTLKIVVG